MESTAHSLVYTEIAHKLDIVIKQINNTALAKDLQKQNLRM